MFAHHIFLTQIILPKQNCYSKQNKDFMEMNDLLSHSEFSQRRRLLCVFFFWQFAKLTLYSHMTASSRIRNDNGFTCRMPLRQWRKIHSPLQWRSWTF